ncbi:MAG TPA: AAA family ATPase, partial [Bellilinea sp.]|nr:AAA family ATPase [Bellilinea sp.]
EAIRRRPYSIVVFDEIEKAHPEAHNMLLQIMEEGHLSDARGRKVDFRNAIIVMTSNIGADLIKRSGGFGFSHQRDEEKEEQAAYEEMRKKLLDSLKKVFRPEFLNRVDSVIVFRPLTRGDINQIVRLELDKVSARMVENGIRMTATDEAVNALADEGYDPDMGARPLRRVIQQRIEDHLSDAILSGEFKEGDELLIDVNADKQIVLTRQSEEPERLPTQ